MTSSRQNVCLLKPDIKYHCSPTLIYRHVNISNVALSCSGFKYSVQKIIMWSTVSTVKAMLHEAIFLATCNATNVALQVARKKFTCNTPFCICNCCVASCKKSRTTLYFSQRCETSCLRVTFPLQLATQFCQNGPIGPIRSHLSRPPSCLLLYALQVAKKLANV